MVHPNARLGRLALSVGRAFSVRDLPGSHPAAVRYTPPMPADPPCTDGPYGVRVAPAPPQVSVARLPSAWYAACWSRELKRKPLSRTVLGTPLALFRDAAGVAAALLDRCPHRNVPLSGGEIVSGTLQCGYHGWRFSGCGSCVQVPGLVGDSEHKGRTAVSFPTREQDGLVWVWADAKSGPIGEPFSLPLGRDPSYTTVRAFFRMEGTLHANLENMLDVPHTAFLHGGLFRSAKTRNPITARVTRTRLGVECEFIGEPRPTGLIGKLIAPGGGEVEHTDRFVLPSVGQVEYRLGKKNHILATQVMTPESDFVTRVYAFVSFRTALPGWLLRCFVGPIAASIMKQDARILRAQTETVKQFGGERFVSTELDLLGPHIWHLLRRAECGELASVETLTRETELLV